MKVALDTNIILRCLLDDDVKQTAAARDLVQTSQFLVISLPTLCEVVWTLSRGYKLEKTKIADALEFLVDSNRVKVDRGAVDLGLEVLRAGGDFADGVIAHDGIASGAEVFATFDKKAATLVKRLGHIETRLVSV
ncbi:DNA-binding protein [Betaproteobacteria bacterium]|nr:DNA-binding protein [Betaproteobacteria bacterium]GHU24675.1 DNA-binding protein [Betaproteobacteria bacterium]